MTIDPCRIGRYEVDTSPLRLTYIIGDDSKIGGFYNFAEELSNCQYPTSTEVIDLPDFATHDPDTQSFRVEYTDDLDLDAIYQVTITSTMTFPTSATGLTPPSSVSATTSFEILLINPCKVTSINSWDIDPILTSYGADAFTVTLPNAFD